MKRIEIIANQSVLEEITDGIEAALPSALYTMIPLAYGKGTRDRKLGTATWPETNFVLVCYCQGDDAEKLRLSVENVRKRFPTEGIAIFSINAEQ